MSAHEYHKHPAFAPTPVLFDGCPECESRSRDLPKLVGALDDTNLDRLWSRMLATEFGQPGDGYQTAAEARAGRILHAAMAAQARLMVSLARLEDLQAGFERLGLV